MSKIVGIMPVRNEDWCLGMTARALLEWVDELLILDHGSTDESRAIEAQISAEHIGHVCRDVDNNPVWEEMRHRQQLLGFARQRGATHIVMVDADEILTANLVHEMRGRVIASPVGTTLQIPWLQLSGSTQTWISSGQWAEQDVSMAFADEPCCHWSARNGYDFHHRHPMGRENIPDRPLGPAFIGRRKGGLMHMQMVSQRRLRAKQALYVMQETVRWPGRRTPDELNAQYGPTVHAPGAQLSPVPPEWWSGYECLQQYLDVDAVPWQEAECKRLWSEYGQQAFAGLDLFGVL